jgi:hypothetical protein
MALAGKDVLVPIIDRHNSCCSRSCSAGRPPGPPGGAVSWPRISHSVVLCGLAGESRWRAAGQDACGVRDTTSRNPRGTPSPMRLLPGKYRQLTGRRACGWIAVCKPSAQPTLVRTQHLPPVNAQVRPGPVGRVSCVEGAVWDSPAVWGASVLILVRAGQDAVAVGSGWVRRPRCCRAWLSSG